MEVVSKLGAKLLLQINKSPTNEKTFPVSFMYATRESLYLVTMAQIVCHGHPNLQNGGETRPLADWTVEWAESRIENKLWCAYHAKFHDMDSFTSGQRLAPFDARYCTKFSNKEVRAKEKPSLTMDTETIRWLANILTITVPDLPAKELTAREKRRQNKGGSSSIDDGGSSAPAATQQRRGKGKRKQAASGNGTQPERDKSVPPKKRGKGKQPEVEAEAPLPSTLTEEEMDQWVMTHLTTLVDYDNDHTNDSDMREVNKNELATYNDFNTDTNWTIALDDVRSQIKLERPNATCTLTTVRIIGA